MVLTIVQINIASDEKIHKWILYKRVTFKVPPRIIPTIKNIGFNNLVGKTILKFVNAKHKFKPRDPNNQGKGRLTKVPKYPPTSPINRAL